MLAPLPLLLLAIAATARMPPIQRFTTGAGTEFGLLTPPSAAAGHGHGHGPPATAKPRPLYIPLANTINLTLTSLPSSDPPDPDYYASACPMLLAAGWACASLDLPSHGAQVEPGEPEGIAGWRWRFDRGQDFLANSSARIADMRAFLRARNLITDTVVVGGISRGGFLAAHYALSSANQGTGHAVSAVGLFSPVTNLSLLTEFQGESAAGQVRLRPTDLQVAAGALSRLNLWSIIGDEDTRVYTDSLVKLMRAVQCERCTTVGEYGCTGCAANRGRNRLSVMYEPLGHTVPPHEHPQDTFAEFARFALQVANVTTA